MLVTTKEYAFDYFQAQLLVEAGDIGVTIVTDQYNNAKGRIEGLLKQYGLID